MIRNIKIDRFGDIDTLDLELGNFNNENAGSGGDSLLHLLLAATQSFVPGYLHEWQLADRPGESSFGGGKLVVQARLFDGGTFSDCVYEESPYCSLAMEFVLENPGSGMYVDKKRAGADDFRELCRLFGEKFDSVRGFTVGLEAAFARRNRDNILSYQMVSVRCERVWDVDITGFYELVVYKNGSNYELYWDELPDIRGARQSGRAKGCNVRMRNLQIQNIVSDGVQDGAGFEEILPSVVMLSRIAADQFMSVKVLDLGREPAGESGSKNTNTRIPCYFVGTHGEYLADVIDTYISGKLRIAWPDPVTGEIRHGLFEEAYEVWRAVLAADTCAADAHAADTCAADAHAADARAIDTRAFIKQVTETVLVQGLILRTGETLVLHGGDGRLPEGFLSAIARMGRQIIVI